MASPQALLQKASRALAVENFDAAADAFTSLINVLHSSNVDKQALALPYLTRSTCNLKLERFQDALDDALILLDLPDCPCPEDVVPGCWTTRQAATVRAANLFEKLGKMAEAEKMRKMWTSISQKAAKDVEKAAGLKEEGNEAFRIKNFSMASAKYMEAIKLDSQSEQLYGNLCASLIKEGKYEEALPYAEELTLRVKPDWAKGWFRKGTILMKLKRYGEAAMSFRSGLEYAPQDQELHKCLLQATSLAEKSDGTAPTAVPFDKQFIGMLWEMKKSSWNVPEWYEKSRGNFKFWSPEDEWEQACTPLLENATFLDQVKRFIPILLPKWKFRKGIAFVEFEKEILGDVDAEATSWKRFILPSFPLITVGYMYQLFCLAYPKLEWHIAFSLTTSIGPGKGGYGVIICKERGWIVDLVGRWLIDEETTGSRGRRAIMIDEELSNMFESGILGNTIQETTHTDGAPDDLHEHDGSVGQINNVYTCSDLAKYAELVESFYKLEVKKKQPEKSTGNESGQLKKEKELPGFKRSFLLSEKEKQHQTNSLDKEAKAIKANQRVANTVILTFVTLIGLFMCGLLTFAPERSVWDWNTWVWLLEKVQHFVWGVGYDG